jgi:hypothetical protein
MLPSRPRQRRTAALTALLLALLVNSPGLLAASTASPDPIAEIQAAELEGAGYARGKVLALSEDQSGLLQYSENPTNNQVVVYGYCAATILPADPPLAPGEDVTIEFLTPTGEQPLATRVQRLPAGGITNATLAGAGKVPAAGSDTIVFQSHTARPQSDLEPLGHSNGEGTKNSDRFSFGKVAALVPQGLTVREYDFAKDADVEVLYQLLPDTETGNICAERPLQIGDNVVLDYLEKDSQRFVTSLIREEPVHCVEPCQFEMEAQSNTDVPPETDEERFGFGKIVGVTLDGLTVQEYDFAKDANVEVIYQLLPDTEIGNISTERPLQIGDDVVFDYRERDCQRILVTLVKEEREEPPAASSKPE